MYSQFELKFVKDIFPSNDYNHEFHFIRLNIVRKIDRPKAIGHLLEIVVELSSPIF